MGLFRSREGSLDSALSPVKSSESTELEAPRRRSSIDRLLRRKKPIVTTVPVSSNASSATSSPRTTDASLTSSQNDKDTKSKNKKQQQQQQRQQQQQQPPLLNQKRTDSNFPAIDLSQTYGRDKQTGEQVIDHTDLLHSLGRSESADSVPRFSQFVNSGLQPLQTGQQLIERLPMKLWTQIFASLSVADKASLSFTCKAIRAHCVAYEAELELPENEQQRCEFLLRLDPTLPDHLFCFACKSYHLRHTPGKEILRPSNIANPIFTCPNAQNLEKRVSRVRVTSGRALPFTFVQMAIRANRISPDHGISVDSLSKRYRERNNDWAHQTRFTIVNDHLLMRVVSTCFAAPALPPAGLRNLLYNPQEEFNPFFSTCPHWRDGELMPSVKCALSHIPKPIEGGGIDRVGREVMARLVVSSNPIVTLCTGCRPMRRCPDCATEYLIEVKTTEDRSEPDPRKRFKQALVVTRWSDLGTGLTPDPLANPAWAACNGSLDGFDSVAAMGRRAVSGVFESQFNVDLIPGQRIISMNPNKERLGERGHNWY